MKTVVVSGRVSEEVIGLFCGLKCMSGVGREVLERFETLANHRGAGG